MKPVLITVTTDHIFHLDNGEISYILRVSSQGLLEHLYFGESLGGASLSIGALFPTSSHRILNNDYEDSCGDGIDTTAQYCLHDIPLEYPTFGNSDYRTPAFHAVNKSGNSLSRLVYVSHKIIEDKPLLNGLPCARGSSKDNNKDYSATLCITLLDHLLNTQIELRYTIYNNHNIIARSSVIKNNSSDVINLKNVYSSCLNLPQSNADDYEILHLHGAWAKEFNLAQEPISYGSFEIQSARGSSSAAHNPFVALVEKNTNEHSGSVFACAIMYSGNFSFSIEKNEFDNVRLLSGLNPFDFNWRLEKGEEFHTPEVLHTYTPNGLACMSHQWHNFIREHISPEQFRSKPRPSYLNSWEACYFEMNEQNILALADSAKEIGVDMFVLDDGWFEGRTDDKRALGDWSFDKKRFPKGLKFLSSEIKKKGLLFGLWFEPEMVNKNSQLYREHKDWLIQVPQRVLSSGRYQYVLDFSHPQVVNYIEQQLDELLKDNYINYIKWDMNRNMTEVGSLFQAPERQQETAHRYILGLYGLLTRLTQKYPQVLFENCASGGNRFDLGMLRFMPQGWLSDMSEPIGRLPIVHGASHLFPLDVFASYIGPSPSHQNGRHSPLNTRFNVGMFSASRGISLSCEDIETHKEELKRYVNKYKNTAKDFIGGDFYRLLFTSEDVCWQLNSQSGDRVYIGYFHVISSPSRPYLRIKLRGLNPNKNYKRVSDTLAKKDVNEENKEEKYSGDFLMKAGINLPYVTCLDKSKYVEYMPQGDFSSAVLVFEVTTS